MTPGWIKLAVTIISVATFTGGCAHCRCPKPKQTMVDSGKGCTLSPGALAERKANFKASIGSKALEKTELEYGIAIRLPKDSATIQAVFDFVAAERRCCGSFLTIEVILNAGDGPFWLRMRGDNKEAGDFLKEIAEPLIAGP